MMETPKQRCIRLLEERDQLVEKVAKLRAENIRLKTALMGHGPFEDPPSEDTPRPERETLREDVGNLPDYQSGTKGGRGT